MGFFSSMFGGSNPTLNAGIKKSGQISDYGTSKGEGMTTAAGDFFQSIMSGDPAKTAKLLAPQIKGIQDRTQQGKQTAAQFGNRSGGTNAKAQTADDTARASVGDMVSKLTGQAATQTAAMGQSLLDTGISALKDQVQFSQTQMDNWQNSLFGQGMSSAAGWAEGKMLPGV